jgi:hypothetical protein
MFEWPLFKSCLAAIVLACVVSRQTDALASDAAAAEIRPAAGIVAETFVELPAASAFTWDERGRLWMLSDHGNRLVLSSVPKAGEVRSVGSFERRGNERAGLLVHGDQAFVSDGDAIRQFEIKEGKYLSEQSPSVAPPNLFPRRVQVTSITWAPTGHISFLYRSNDDSGVGRLDLRRDRWDVVAKGLAGDLAYDVNGFPVASDEPSGHFFRLRLGLDYGRGLHNYAKRDLALDIDRPEVRAGEIVTHPGAHWPEENRGTWLVADRETSSLQQFKEDDRGGLTHWRDLARWDSGGADCVDLQIGPDGAVWMLLSRAAEETSGGRATGALHRLHPADLTAPPQLPEIPSLETKDVVALLGHANAWQRETALRVLDDREELRQARGLHPGTPLGALYGDANASAVARVYALLSLHRVELLDEVTLESASGESDPALRAWAALLFGERNYPTGTSFNMLMKLAQEPDLNVRMAVAVAARQFVSGTLAVDTAPRAMPIREVYTGGLLSALWFSTEQSRSPAFELLFWNALKPISAYDAAHPIGFFTEEFKESVPIANWIVGLVAEQIAQQDDPLKQEDAMLMVGKLKPANAPLVLATLQGLKRGTPRLSTVPTEKSLNVLEVLSRNDNREIATLAGEILSLWQKPVQHK